MSQVAGDRRSLRLALADSTRVRLFDLLSERPRSVRELADLLDTQPDRLYYHLRRLEAAGLVSVHELRRTADGHAERVYRADHGVVSDQTQDAAAGVLLLGAVLDATRLELERLAESVGGDGPQRLRPPRAVLRRARLALAPAEIDELQERIWGIVGEFAREATDGPRIPVQLVYTLFEGAPGTDPDG